MDIFSIRCSTSTDQASSAFRFSAALFKSFFFLLIGHEGRWRDTYRTYSRGNEISPSRLCTSSPPQRVDASEPPRRLLSCETGALFGAGWRFGATRCESTPRPGAHPVGTREFDTAVPVARNTLIGLLAAWYGSPGFSGKSAVFLPGWPGAPP